MRLLVPFALLLGLALMPESSFAITLDDGETYVISDAFTYDFDDFRLLNGTQAIVDPGGRVATTQFAADISTENGAAIHVNGGTIGGFARWQLAGPGEFLMTSGVMDTSAFAEGQRHAIDVGPETPFRVVGGTWYRTPANVVDIPHFEVGPDVVLPEVEFPDLDLIDVEFATVQAGHWGIVTVNALEVVGAVLRWNAGADVLFVQSGPAVTIEGGVIQLFETVGDTVIEGGTIELLDGLNAGTTTILGGEILEMDVNGSSTVILEGSDFNYPNGPIEDSEGTLTGTLLDGTPIDAPFTRESPSEIRVVPEPVSAFAISGALFALALLRRRRPSDSSR